MVILVIIIVVETITLMLPISKCRRITVLKATVLSNVAPAIFIYALINFGIAEQLYFENNESIGFCVCLNIFIGLIVLAFKTPALYLIIKDGLRKDEQKKPELLKSTIISVCVITTIMGALFERIYATVL